MKIYKTPGQLFDLINGLSGKITICCGPGMKSFIEDSAPEFLARASIVEVPAPLRCGKSGKISPVSSGHTLVEDDDEFPSSEWLESDFEIASVVDELGVGGVFIFDRLAFGQGVQES